MSCTQAKRSRGRPKKATSVAALEVDDDNVVTSLEQPPAKRSNKKSNKNADLAHDLDVESLERDDAEEQKTPSTNGKQKWENLAHNGILFAPPYVPHGMPLIYDGRTVYLSEEAEEVASMFAKHVGGEHAKNPIFCKNFFVCFTAVLDRTMPNHGIKMLEKCDFGAIAEKLQAMSAENRASKKLNKEAEAEAKAAQKTKYGFALVNGKLEPLANFQVEPPSLFLGRGQHPKAGMLKERIYPKDVTLNIGGSAPIPDCPLEGHSWGSVVSDPKGAWIARWTDTITGSYKYVRFSYSSSLGGASDRKKYEKARSLKTCIDRIRAQYTKELTSETDIVRQRATIIWMLDNLALRVGNEKNLNETADTVGCCSLRVEHVTLHPPSSIELDFLGKDSMRYTKLVEVPKNVYKNFAQFVKGRAGSDLLFDAMDPSLINTFLNSLMSGLTAKVFRTYNASVTLEAQLGEFSAVFGGAPGEVPVKVPDLRLFYNRANRQVAVLCNHQKSVSKSHGKQIDSLDGRIAGMRSQIQDLESHMEHLQESEGIANQKKRKRRSTEEEENVSQDKENGVFPNDPETKKPKLPTTVEATKNRIAKILLAIENLESTKQDKGEGATIQNSTSKINYMDPRITVSFCKKSGLPLTKVFPATLMNRFAWAIAEIEDDPDFQF